MTIKTTFITNQFRFLDEFRKIDSTMPVGEILFLLQVFLMSEPNTKQVAQAANIPESSASRYLTHLSNGRPHMGRNGLNFLTTFENPLDRKQKLIQVTEKGREFLKKLSAEYK